MKHSHRRLKLNRPVMRTKNFLNQLPMSGKGIFYSGFCLKIRLPATK